MLTVELSYFKLSGKWYTDAKYQTGDKPLREIWEEIINKLRANNPPGLFSWHNDFMVLVNVPQHEHAHPIIIMPTEETQIKDNE